jgi:hypothetical protein
MAAEVPTEVVHSFKLKGHKQAVLCLASNHGPCSFAAAEEAEDPSTTVQQLWSGSQDATCRLFDLRTHGRHAVVGILAGAPVLSVAPDPARQLIYVAAGDAVTVYDVRHPVQPLIRKDAGRSVLQADDEINQILLFRSNKGEDSNMHLIAGDDAGNLYSTNLGTSNNAYNEEETSAAPPRRLVHDAQAMVTSIACLPAGAPRQESDHDDDNDDENDDDDDDEDDDVEAQPILISGGTDCTLVAWRNGRRRSSLHVPNTATDVNQICNPPMVHTMAVLPTALLSRHENGDDGDDECYRILAGFGDHSLGVISLSKTDQRLEWVCRMENVPADAVATSNRYNRIGSAGGGTVAVWGPSHNDDVLRQRLAIPHAAKVNAVSWGDVNDATIFVADTSNDITGYKIPR